MGGVLSAVLGVFTGGLSSDIRKAVEALAGAKTEKEQIAAKVHLAEVEAQTSRALAGGRLIIWIQVAWASIFLVYDAKLVIWDKVLGLGVTDALSPDLVARQALIMSFLFGPSAFRRAFGR